MSEAKTTERLSFVLDVDEWLQGSLDLRSAKKVILLTFQVNCPGCFMHALPAAIALEKDEELKAAGVAVAVVATAFEDWEYNTKANLQKLLETGAVVGETRKYFAARRRATAGSDESKSPAPVTSGEAAAVKCDLDLSGLTVGWDNVRAVTPEEQEEAIAKLLQQFVAQSIASMPPSRRNDDAVARLREMALPRVRQVVKAQIQRRAETFMANGMQGTPTWAVLRVDDAASTSLSIQHMAIGHPSHAELKALALAA